MSGTEVVTVISGLINLVGGIAAFFGWKRHQEVKETAERVERAGEAVIQGVEACEQVLGTDEAQQVKRSIRKVAEAAGTEGFLHEWLVRLGLARKNRDQ
jgi:hypothetical protein